MSIYSTKMSLDDLEVFLSRIYPEVEITPILEASIPYFDQTLFILPSSLAPHPEWERRHFEGVEDFYYRECDSQRVQRIIENINKITPLKFEKEGNHLSFSDSSLGEYCYHSILLLE